MERLFGVGNNINEVIKVTFNGKIKSPPSIDPGLPNTPGLIVFFGVQRRMMEIAQELAELLAKLALNPVGGFLEGASEAF